MSIYRDYDFTTCNCLGPQNDQPLCPCAMKKRGIYQRDGRWIQPEQDLGPVQNLREIWERQRGPGHRPEKHRRPTRDQCWQQRATE